jgi:hypothetical protein
MKTWQRSVWVAITSLGVAALVPAAMPGSGDQAVATSFSHSHGQNATFGCHKHASNPYHCH